MAEEDDEELEDDQNLVMIGLNSEELMSSEEPL